MISIDGLAVEFGGTTLFSDVSFVINEKDRIALMGKNGNLLKLRSWNQLELMTLSLLVLFLQISW